MKRVEFAVMKPWVLITSLLILFCCAGNAVAQEADTWEFDLTIYGWLAGIDGDMRYPVGDGSNISVDASDIIDNLEMIFMGGFQAKYNRWSILTDLIYMDIGDNVNRTVTVGSAGVPVNATVGLDISSWVVHGGVGYDVVQSDRGILAVLGGVRYLALEVDAQMGLYGPSPIPAPSTERSESMDQLDGIVGLKGMVKLNENWYLPYYADIGAGDSDLTWQLFGGIGYRFGWGDIKLGYRYLKYELDDGRLLEELELSGPILGVGFRF